jgi:hypothetical protein
VHGEAAIDIVGRISGRDLDECLGRCGQAGLAVNQVEEQVRLVVIEDRQRIT